jgi:hypothetical protein
LDFLMLCLISNLGEIRCHLSFIHSIWGNYGNMCVARFQTICFISKVYFHYLKFFRTWCICLHAH